MGCRPPGPPTTQNLSPARIAIARPLVASGLVSYRVSVASPSVVDVIRMSGSPFRVLSDPWERRRASEKSSPPHLSPLTPRFSCFLRHHPSDPRGAPVGEDKGFDTEC